MVERWVVELSWRVPPQVQAPRQARAQLPGQAQVQAQAQWQARAQKRVRALRRARHQADQPYRPTVWFAVPIRKGEEGTGTPLALVDGCLYALLSRR